MKKLNIDELIWFFILIILDISNVYLIISENIYSFVEERTIVFFYIGLIILTILSIFQFNKIFTIRSRKDITLKFIPMTFVLIIGTLLLFIIPAYEIIYKQ